MKHTSAYRTRLWFGLMIHCDAWKDSAGRNAVCLRFKCTMCKKESCASGMFFFAASDLGGATPCQFDVRNMMVWTRELHWNRAIVGICVTCLGCNSRTGLFWDLLPCYFWQSDQANAGPWNLIAKRKQKDIYSSTISIIMADGSSPISIGCQLYLAVHRTLIAVFSRIQTAYIWAVYAYRIRSFIPNFLYSWVLSETPLWQSHSAGDVLVIKLLLGLLQVSELVETIRLLEDVGDLAIQVYMWRPKWSTRKMVLAAVLILHTTSNSDSGYISKRVWDDSFSLRYFILWSYFDICV